MDDRDSGAAAEAGGSRGQRAAALFSGRPPNRGREGLPAVVGSGSGRRSRDLGK
jgi:hypothetical protein